jgi:hypothetical protein
MPTWFRRFERAETLCFLMMAQLVGHADTGRWAVPSAAQVGTGLSK